MIDTSLFPYENHLYRLEFGEKKEKTVCFFSCEEHLQKYLNRYKLNKSTVKIDYRDGESTQPSKTNKNKILSGTGKSSDRSASRGRKSTKGVDTNRNTHRTRKSK